MIYRTRTFITLGLYTFYPIFEGQKRLFKELKEVMMARVRYSNSLLKIEIWHFCLSRMRPFDKKLPLQLLVASKRPPQYESLYSVLW